MLLLAREHPEQSTDETGYSEMAQLANNGALEPVVCITGSKTLDCSALH